MLRDHFPGKNPMRIDKAGKKAVAREVLQRLKAYPYARPEEKRYYYGSDKDQKQEQLICAFSANEPDRWSSYRDDFDLFRRPDGTVVIEAGYQEAAVSSLDEIDALLADYGRRIERRKALAAKRAKVHSLKARAVTAQVRKIASELDFTFAVTNDNQKMILLVQLNKQEAIQLNVPYKGFEEVLPRLGQVITSLRALHATGIRFKVVGRSQWGWRTEWISPKKTETPED